MCDFAAMATQILETAVQIWRSHFLADETWNRLSLIVFSGLNESILLLKKKIIIFYDLILSAKNARVHQPTCDN